MTTAEITPASVKIDRLISRIDDGDIKIPAFQRGFVWKQNQIIELLESIANNYPIGSLLFWKSSEIIKSTRNLAGYKIPIRDDTYPVNYVLDGQQRLATIYGVFSQIVEQEGDSGHYNPNLNIFEIYYDFVSKTFISKDDIKSPESCIYLRSLLNVSKLLETLKTFDEAYHSDASKLSSIFLNYEIPVVTIEKRNRADVGTIFERINNTGTRLTTLDLMTAWTWTDDFHLLDASDAFMEELDEKGFGDIKPIILLQIISGIICNSTKTENILKLTGEQIRDNWDKVLESVRKAIDFLATDIHCIHADFLPFHQQLIGISKYYSEISNPTAEQIQLLRQWFWKTSFSKRYSSGQTNAKMDDDIVNMISLKKGDNNAFDSYGHDVTVPLLRDTQFSKANPITRSLLLLMAQYTPLDLIKTTKIDIGTALSQYNRKEYHHIFPEAILKQIEIPRDKIYCVLNFCFLCSDSNKKISKKKPSVYFFELISNVHFNHILDSNLIPTDKKVYQDNDYESFMEKRANLFIIKIDEVCNR